MPPKWMPINGVSVVHVRPPDSMGISHNRYERFDIEAKGAVLNNSPLFQTKVSTSGYVPANPSLQHGAARIIFNEVAGTKPTQLRGYIEVAGTPAEIIIANPHGIHCAGCGLINVPRGVLTTGTPQWDEEANDLLYAITQGKIEIAPPPGKPQAVGLNAINLEQIDLIARAVQFNQQLYAQRINVVTGPQMVPHAAPHQPMFPLPGEGAVPPFALEVAALGGMTAQQIYVVGTEAGVGIKSEGTFDTQQFQLSSQGPLTLKLCITSQVNLTIKSQGAIEQAGQLESPHLQLHSAQQLHNNGTVLGEYINLTAPDLLLGGQLQAKQQLHLVGQHIDSAGEHVSGAWLNATADRIQLQPNSSGYSRGHLRTGKTLTLSLAHLNNQAGNFSTDEALNIQLARGPLAGFFQARGALQFDLQDNYTTHEALKWQSPQLTLNLTGRLTNAIALQNAGDLPLIAPYIDNQAEGMIESRYTQLQAQVRLLNQGCLHGDVIQIETLYLENANQSRPLTGLIAARQQLRIGTEKLINHPHSTIVSGGTAWIAAAFNATGHATQPAQEIENRSGVIEAQEDLHIYSTQLKNINTQVEIELAAVAQETRAEYEGITQETRLKQSLPAHIRAGRHLFLSGHVLNDKSQIVARANLSELAEHPLLQLENCGVEIQRIITDRGIIEINNGPHRSQLPYTPDPTKTPLSLGMLAEIDASDEAFKILTQQGFISADYIQINSQIVDNTGILQGRHHVRLKAQSMTQSSGEFLSQGLLHLQTEQALHSSGLLTAPAIQLEAGQDLQLQGEQQKIQAGHLWLHAGRDLKLSGNQVSATGDALLTAGRDIKLDVLSSSPPPSSQVVITPVRVI